MRWALWLAALFCVAALGALFVGGNQATVTLFWPPQRIDLSLNLALLLLLLCFGAIHFLLRALSALFSIPQQARRWRLLQKERAIQSALLDALSHLVAGRFLRSRKAAELVVSLEQMVERSGERLSFAARLRSLAHLIAAESAHALQNRAVRDVHLAQALQAVSRRDGADVRDGVQLRAARWAFEDRDASAAMEHLDQLPQGAGRRTLALRLRFKVARLGGKSRMALETVRLLTKHRAFSELAGKSIVRGLAIEMLRAARDPAQVQSVWDFLDSSERQMPELALEGAERLLAAGGPPEKARQWLLGPWELMAKNPQQLPVTERVRMVRALELSFSMTGAQAPDGSWLNRIELAQMANPREPTLQYLAGITCLRLGLWGKAQQMLKQALAWLEDPDLRRDAWKAVAELAHLRQDSVAATEAYRSALAETTQPRKVEAAGQT
jgi:HemY protein